LGGAEPPLNLWVGFTRRLLRLKKGQTNLMNPGIRGAPSTAKIRSEPERE